MMKPTTVILLALVVATVAVAASVSAEEGIEPVTEDAPCVKVYLDPPGVVVNPWCIWDHIPPT